MLFRGARSQNAKNAKNEKNEKNERRLSDRPACRADVPRPLDALWS